MKRKFKIGTKVIYTRKGQFHAEGMDKYLGQIVTIRRYEPYNDIMLANIAEDGGACYYDVSCFTPVIAKVR